MYQLKISKAAQDDMHKSSLWYNEQQTDLGNEFLKEVFKTLNYIQNNPQLYMVRFSEKFRFAKVYRFPFLVVYEIYGDTVIVNGVFHTSRNPTEF